MSYVVTTDIICDVCQDWIDGVTGKTVRVRDARRNAAGAGWVYRGVGTDVCDRCRRKEATAGKAVAERAVGGES